MTTELKQSVNELQVVGTVKEVNMKFDPSLVNAKNPKIVGAITKVEPKNPALTVECNGQIMGFDIFPTYKHYVSKKEETKGKLVDNFNFSNLEKIMKEYSTGMKVRVTGTFAENGYAGQDGTWVSKNGWYLSRVSHVADDAEEVARGNVSGIIYNMKEEEVNDNPTGRLLVDFYLVEYNKSVFPLHLVADGKIADKFQDVYSKGDSTKLVIELTEHTFGKKKQTEEDDWLFGDEEAEIVSGGTIIENQIINGSRVVDDEESDLYVDIDAFKEALKNRKVYIEAKIEEKKSGKKKSSGRPNGQRGLGLNTGAEAKVEEEADVDEDPFAD